MSLDPPFSLDSCTAREIPRTELLCGDAWHTDGCSCDRRQRLRTIVDRYPDHEVELWACVRCGGLYWRQPVHADHADAPRQMRDEHTAHA